MEGSQFGSSQTDESEAERNNRNLSDLLQELRVAGLGVRVLSDFCSAYRSPFASAGLMA
jgi:hypothetical protein